MVPSLPPPSKSSYSGTKRKRASSDEEEEQQQKEEHHRFSTSILSFEGSVDGGSKVFERVFNPDLTLDSLRDLVRTKLRLGAYSVVHLYIAGSPKDRTLTVELKDDEDFASFRSKAIEQPACYHLRFRLDATRSTSSSSTSSTTTRTRYSFSPSPSSSSTGRSPTKKGARRRRRAEEKEAIRKASCPSDVDENGRPQSKSKSSPITIIPLFPNLSVPRPPPSPYTPKVPSPLGHAVELSLPLPTEQDVAVSEAFRTKKLARRALKRERKRLRQGAKEEKEKEVVEDPDVVDSGEIGQSQEFPVDVG
ncbi:hypothetical protein BDY24DRAFT_418978 [Mrakia frigida]|uniref:uncharacterized protein n=1 Tax=Mrakia frigida TaxID=29902 RepID=UPI003FCC2302